MNTESQTYNRARVDISDSDREDKLELSKFSTQTFYKEKKYEVDTESAEAILRILKDPKKLSSTLSQLKENELETLEGCVQQAKKIRHEFNLSTVQQVK